MKTPVNTKTPVTELKAAGLFIEFEDEVSESKVKTILESCNLTMNYSIKYNTDGIADKYYIMKRRMDPDIGFQKKMQSE